MLQPTPNARTIQLPQAHGGLQCVAFEVNMIQENCYLLWDATREAVLVDDGAFYPEERAYIDAFIAEHDLRLVHLLITHGHFDHIFGLDHLSSRYNLLPEMGRNERATYEAAKEQMTAFLHRAFPLEVPPAGRMLNEGDEVSFGTHTLRIINTPGHTPGGICFYEEAHGVLLSGDSLFQGAIGRCDLPGGNMQTLVRALSEKVMTLPEQVCVLPGHGPTTTIGQEKRMNPYL